MAKYNLKAESPLDGYQCSFDATTLSEVTDMAIVSIAVPNGGQTVLNKAVQKALSCVLPDVGKTSVYGDGEAHLLGLQTDQIFAMFPHEGNRAVDVIADSLGNNGYYADQSDSWAVLRLSGPASVSALERICLLDLDESVFEVGQVARTQMEHLGVILLRESKDSFLLMSAASSAPSFLHAVETSLRHIS